MGIDCKILLPLHVKAKNVFYVIHKSVGTEFIQRTFDKDQWHGREVKKIPTPFDGTLPSNKENPWFLEPKNPISIEKYDFDYSLLRFTFQDICGNHYDWMFHPETEYEDGKLLNPGSSVLAVALAKRLVDFFGGHAIYQDSDDEISYQINPKKALYPTKTKEQSSDDRWYQFYNALNSVQLVTVKELESAQQYSGYFTDRDKALLDFLYKKEQRDHLDNQLNIKESKIIKNKI